MSERNLGGAPTKYDPKYCDMLIEHMNQGFSYRSFAGLIGTTYKTLYNWEKEHPEFLHAKEQGVAKCMLYDERILQKGIEGKQRGYNIAAHKWKMANIHRWSERVETDSKVTSINLTVQSEDVDL